MAAPRWPHRWRLCRAHSFAHFVGFMQMPTSRVELFEKSVCTSFDHFGSTILVDPPSWGSVGRVEGRGPGGATMAPPLKAAQSAQLRTLRRIHANAYVSCGTARKKILRIV